MADGTGEKEERLTDESGRMTAGGFRRLGEVLEGLGLKSETCALTLEAEGRKSQAFRQARERWRKAHGVAVELLKQSEGEAKERGERESGG